MSYPHEKLRQQEVEKFPKTSLLFDYLERAALELDKHVIVLLTLISVVSTLSSFLASGFGVRGLVKPSFLLTLVIVILGANIGGAIALTFSSRRNRTTEILKRRLVSAYETALDHSRLNPLSKDITSESTSK